MRLRLRISSIALVFGLIAAAPVSAAEPAQDQFKTEIEEFLNRLSVTTQGVVGWEGSDALDFRREGDAAIAVVSNARLTIHGAKTSELVFDHIEIRRTPAPGTPNAAKFDIVFPARSTLILADGTQTSLGLKDATASLVVDEASNRFRETVLTFASARLEHASAGDWISFGPLSFASKLVGTADGGWSQPIDFDLRQVEFLLTEVPVGGTIDRVAYSAGSSGPDIAALNRFRERIDALRQQGERPPAARLDALLELLPAMPALFSLVKGEVTIEGVAVHTPSGEPLVGLGKASIGGALTGLSGDTAAWRVTLRQSGLTLANTILDPSKVPQNIVIDFGLEDVGTGPLRTILEAIGKLRNGANGVDSQQATQQMLGAAVTLNPVFRLYEMALRTKDVGIAATAEAKGLPFTPKGYTAEGDVAVRGFDALPALVADAPYAQYLPLLKVLGTAAAGSDTKFHLASTPQKWITVNGNDVSGWFGGDNPAPGQPRRLRLAQPLLQGDDVRAVQQALAGAKITAPRTGVYDGPTAAAVAQFQRQGGLNVDGVVNTATRDKLGVKPAPAPQPGGPKPPSRSN